MVTRVLTHWLGFDEVWVGYGCKEALICTMVLASLRGRDWCLTRVLHGLGLGLGIEEPKTVKLLCRGLSEVEDGPEDVDKGGGGVTL